MNVQQLIYEQLNGDFLAGDAFLCLQLAVSLQDHKEAVKAGMRCMDLARHLETKCHKDPAHQPAPETVPDEGICGRCSGTNIVWYADSPLWNATVRMADGRDEYPFLCPVCFAELAEERGHAPSGIWSLKLDQYQTAPETVEESRHNVAISVGIDTEVCQDWHGAVREMRTGTPNSAMSAVIAPTPSTPGWLDKAAEALAEKHVDSDEEIYQWGGGRWCVMDGKTFCWNARECEWNESTMLPEQLRQDGTRTN